MITNRPPADLRQHPLSGLVPPMRAGEWRSFLADVQERGVLEPLHLAPDDVTVLDGRHRLRAALETGLESVPTTPAHLDGQSEIGYMIKAAVLRRHLTDDQRAMLACDMAKEMAGQRRSEAAKRAAEMRWSGCVEATIATTHESEPVRTREVVAQTFGVSAHKVRTAAGVVRMAPDLAEKVAVGEIQLRKVAGQVARRERLAELAALPEVPEDDRYRVWHGDFRELGGQIADSSIDLILTDPPYVAKGLSLWPDLAALGARVLRPGGLLVSYCGQFFLPQCMAAMSEHLAYYWLAGIEHTGPPGHHFSRQVVNAFKPILVYQKPPERAPFTWWTDLVRGSGREKQDHAWQQGVEESRALVRAFSGPGGLILDPFAGSGTFAVAAALEGRRSLAIEIDGDHCETIRKRRPAVEVVA